jgi:hypothetical protein
MICQLCGVQAATRHVVFYQNIGALIMRFHKSIEGELCKTCIHEQFWMFTLVNVTLGWWGIISLIVTPFFIINNVARYLMCLSMPPAGANTPAVDLTDEAIQKIQPYASYIVEQLRAGNAVEQVVAAVAQNAGVSPAQVERYIVALAQAMQQPA